MPNAAQAAESLNCIMAMSMDRTRSSVQSVRLVAVAIAGAASSTVRCRARDHGCVTNHHVVSSTPGPFPGGALEPPNKTRRPIAS